MTTTEYSYFTDKPKSKEMMDVWHPRKPGNTYESLWQANGGDLGNPLPGEWEGETGFNIFFDSSEGPQYDKLYPDFNKLPSEHKGEGHIERSVWMIGQKVAQVLDMSNGRPFFTMDKLEVMIPEVTPDERGICREYDPGAMYFRTYVDGKPRIHVLTVHYEFLPYGRTDDPAVWGLLARLEGPDGKVTSNRQIDRVIKEHARAVLTASEHLGVVESGLLVTLDPKAPELVAPIVNHPGGDPQ